MRNININHSAICYFISSRAPVGVRGHIRRRSGPQAVLGHFGPSQIHQVPRSGYRRSVDAVLGLVLLDGRGREYADHRSRRLLHAGRLFLRRRRLKLDSID